MTNYYTTVEGQAQAFISFYNLLNKEKAIPTREELENIAIQYVMGNPDLGHWTVLQVMSFVKHLETGITTSQKVGI